VKNEEKIISAAISRCFCANYPEDKLEVIVVNDGSRDATFDEIKKCKEEYPRLKVIDFKEHKGKRQAIAAGATLSKGEIIACLDSDSLLNKDALYYLVQGFTDPSVGAVCGHAYILNSDENALTRMQEVRNFIAFRVIKAAEHVFSSVTCCSGSLSAYRREYLTRVMDKWLNQTFLGKAATFGDDRSLTNLILRKYRVLYDDRAVVETAAPSGWKKFFRQQLRWKKSWFRESLNACGFIWRRHPAASLSFYIGFILPLISPLVVFKVFVYQPLLLGKPSHYYALGLGLMSLLFSLYYLAKRPNRKWIYGIYFCVLYTVLLSWQIYYAIITCRRNHWGTR
jgi:hyaluronan synthase